MSREDINKELYKFLKETVDDTGLPVMDTKLFVKTTEDYDPEGKRDWNRGREVFRATLAEFISKEKPPFPFKIWDDKKREVKFYGLKGYDYSKYIMSKERNKDVMEKYDDYKYPYSEYGIRVIDGSAQFNYISDSFMEKLRMDCSSYGYKSPVQRWKNADGNGNIWGVFGPIWRGINKSKRLTPLTYVMAFRLGTYIATQFKPTVAKTIYEISNAKTVLDTSMGWGDRLTGFYASNATHYIGCDPNPNTFKVYEEMIKYYDKLTGGQKTTQIYNCGAEDLPWDEINNVDCAFTSPPYFSTERYNEGGEKEELQSWAKYNEYNKWRDEFYLPVAKNSFDSLSHNGVLMVNILDPKVNGIRHRSGDELVESLKDNFIGQIGMRIQQRPQGASVFKDKDGNFDKAAMNEFMNKIYIENIWCFSKNKNKGSELFPEKGTLEDFL